MTKSKTRLTIPYHEAFPKDAKYMAYFYAKNPDYVRNDQKIIAKLTYSNPDDAAQISKDIQSFAARLYWMVKKYELPNGFAVDKHEEMETICKEAILYCTINDPQSCYLPLFYARYANFLLLCGRNDSARYIAHAGLQCKFSKKNLSKKMLTEIINAL